MNGAIVLTLVGIAVFISMLFRNRLPPPKPSAVGIDLGTTFSAVGIFNTGVGDVTLPIIFENDTIMPSIIAYDSKNDRFLVGKEAKRSSSDVSFSHNVFYDMKRFIGRLLPQASSNDSEVDQNQSFYDANRYPFVISTSNSRQENLYQFPLFNDVNDIDINQIASDAFHNETHNKFHIKKQVFAHELSAQILNYLKIKASEYTNKKVDAVVIGVPVNFDKKQREYTRKAADLAGLKVLALADEPTLAAMAYGLHEQSDVKLVIVYDLGGGTLDVSLLEKQTDSMFVVLDSTGDSHFGGQDFNHAVFNYLLPKLTKKAQQNESIIRLLRDEIERIKQFLNSEQGDIENSKVKLNIPKESLINSNEILELSRNEFDSICEKLLTQATEPINKVLNKRGINVDEIDRIVMVGGSSRLRAIRERVSKAFNGAELHTSVPPEHAVAIGAALAAARLTAQWPLPMAVFDASDLDGDIDDDDVDKDEI